MSRNILNALFENKDLSPDQHERLTRAFEKQSSGFVQALSDPGIVSEADILQAAAQIYNLPYVPDLGISGPMPQTERKISRRFLKTYSIVPVFRENKKTMIAVNEPGDLTFADDLIKILKLEPGSWELVLAERSQILTTINMLYDQSGEDVQQLVENMEDNDSVFIDDFEQTADLLDDTSDAPVIRLVNQMISKAVKAGASDIHIEPFQDTLKVRYRIDGILYEMLKPPKIFQSTLISRIKVMARMNIAEKRVPQDGRAQVRIGNQEIDLRISTVPTAFGERLVIRLLNKSGYFLAFDEFGLTEANKNLMHGIIRQNHGIVLVTGPTGSGKTTTLYAGLSEINATDKSIITIEDPVEYNLEGIGQIQVNTKTGVTFARGLRSIVRQDPDVILIGEIRDIETAEIAIQSALTGHLVFSTLHTNDAPGAITRLVDLGVEPYLISSSLNHIIAQRLVRVLCEHCKQEYRLTESDVAGLENVVDVPAGSVVFKPYGCDQCFHTGYSGRQAIMEILVLDEELKSVILHTSDANRIRETAIKKGMITLRRDGMAKVRQGITSIREVLRVTQE